MNLIIASHQDLAGVNIAHHLIELFDFEQTKKDQYLYKDCILALIEKDSVYAEFVEKEFDDDPVINPGYSSLKSNIFHKDRYDNVN